MPCAKDRMWAEQYKSVVCWNLILAPLCYINTMQRSLSWFFAFLTLVKFESYYLSNFSFILLWLSVWSFHMVFLWSEDGNSSLPRKLATTIRCASRSFEWTLQAGDMLISNILINWFPKHQNWPQNYGWSSVWEWDKSLQRVEAVSPPRLAQLLSSCCCYVVWCATVLQHTRVVVRRGPAATNPVFALSFGFPHLDWMTTVVVTDMRFASRVASNSDSGSHHCSLCTVQCAMCSHLRRCKYFYSQLDE